MRDLKPGDHNHGSCHTMEAMPSSENIKLAKHFLEHPHKWGNYNLKSNNCETFACFCKTGLMKIAAQLHPTRNVVKEAFHIHHAKHMNKR